MLVIVSVSYLKILTRITYAVSDKELGKISAPPLSPTSQGKVASKISIPLDASLRSKRGVTAPWNTRGRCSGSALYKFWEINSILMTDDVIIKHEKNTKVSVNTGSTSSQFNFAAETPFEWNPSIT